MRRWHQIATWLMLAIAAACGSADPGAGAKDGGAVAWVDRPAPPYVPPMPSPLPYTTDAPLCRADQLRATGPDGGAATGHVDERFTFTNVSRSACRLEGFPTVSGVAPDGRRVTLHPTRSPGGTWFGTMLPADMAAGRHTYLDMATEDVTCRLGPPFVYRELAFGLPNGGSLTSHARLTRLCGGWQMSRFGLPPRTTATGPPKPGSLDALRVTISLPSTARAGSTLNYLVTLSNPTHTLVELDPCPSYTEAVSIAYIVVNGTRQAWPRQPRISPAFALNCDTVRSIAPGRRVRYRMQLRLPPMPAGLAKFGWHLNTPREPGTGTVLTITRAP